MKFLKIACLLFSMFFFSSNAFAGEAGVSVSGPDMLTNGACYSATGGQAPYLWTTSEGSISGSGCVSDVSGRCGSAAITASDDCRITGSKEVILHGGVGAISISGADAPSNGSCYVANNAVGAVQWGITKGSINSNGCVSNISGQCGAATVTATDSCGETAVKNVRMSKGKWVLIISEQCPSFPSYRCYYTVTIGSKKYNNWLGCSPCGIHTAPGSIRVCRVAPDCFVPRSNDFNIIDSVRYDEYKWSCP